MSVKTKLKDKQAELDAKRAELHGIFTEAGADLDMDKVKSLSGDSAEKVAEIRERNKAIDDLAAEVEGLKAVEDAALKSLERGDGESGSEADAPAEKKDREVKSFGQHYVEAPAFKDFRGGTGPMSHIDVDLKTLFQTSAGWEPEAVRGPRLVLDAQRPIQVTDIVPQTETRQNAVKFMEETTFTNNAAEVTEGNAYGEAALVLTEQSSTVRKIGVFLPVTDEQFEDEPRARSYVDNRLPFMVRQRLDSQILVGDGIAPNLDGFLNVNGIQTQAKGADPVPDAVYKAMDLVRVTGRAMPGAVIFHPNDWQGVRLLRTADGIYIWGSPSEAGPARIWGLPVVLSDAITENTALVGDYTNFTELAVRRGLDIQVSNSHDDYFVKGKLAVRADVRAALVVYRPAALCTVTGI